MGSNLGARDFGLAYLSTGRITAIATATPTQRDSVIHTVTWSPGVAGSVLTVTALRTGQVVAALTNGTLTSGSSLFDVFCPGGFSYTATGGNPDFTITYQDITPP